MEVIVKKNVFLYVGAVELSEDDPFWDFLEILSIRILPILPKRASQGQAGLCALRENCNLAR